MVVANFTTPIVKGVISMKIKCNVFKFSDGMHWFGISIGGSLEKGQRQLNIQFDLFNYGVIFSIQEKGLKFGIDKGV